LGRSFQARKGRPVFHGGSYPFGLIRLRHAPPARLWRCPRRPKGF